jgi:hypothetical protein
MTWVTNYMLLKCQLKLQNHAPNNTVICQVKISRAAMKAAQEAKSSKSRTCKGRKNNIFQTKKASVVKLVAFLIFAVLTSISSIFLFLEAAQS